MNGKNDQSLPSPLVFTSFLSLSPSLSSKKKKKGKRNGVLRKAIKSKKNPSLFECFSGEKRKKEKKKEKSTEDVDIDIDSK